MNKKLCLFISIAAIATAMENPNQSQSGCPIPSREFNFARPTQPFRRPSGKELNEVKKEIKILSDNFKKTIKDSQSDLPQMLLSKFGRFINYLDFKYSKVFFFVPDDFQQDRMIKTSQNSLKKFIASELVNVMALFTETLRKSIENQSSHKETIAAPDEDISSAIDRGIEYIKYYINDPSIAKYKDVTDDVKKKLENLTLQLSKAQAWPIFNLYQAEDVLFETGYLEKLSAQAELDALHDDYVYKFDQSQSAVELIYRFYDFLFNSNRIIIEGAKRVPYKAEQSVIDEINNELMKKIVFSIIPQIVDKIFFGHDGVTRLPVTRQLNDRENKYIQDKYSEVNRNMSLLVRDAEKFIKSYQGDNKIIVSDYLDKLKDFLIDTGLIPAPLSWEEYESMQSQENSPQFKDEIAEIPGERFAQENLSASELSQLMSQVNLERGEEKVEELSDDALIAAIARLDETQEEEISGVPLLEDLYSEVTEEK